MLDRIRKNAWQIVGGLGLLATALCIHLTIKQRKELDRLQEQHQQVKQERRRQTKDLSSIIESDGNGSVTIKIIPRSLEETIRSNEVFFKDQLAEEEYEPETPEYCTELGNRMVKTTKGAKRALHWFDKALELDPKSSDSIYGRAKALEIIGEYEQALQALDDLEKLDIELPEDFLITKADIFEGKGDYEESIKTLELELEKNPENDDARSEIAHHYVHIDQFDNAVEIYSQIPMTRGEEFNTPYLEAQFASGAIREEQKRYNDAITHYTNVVFLMDHFIAEHNKRRENCDRCGNIQYCEETKHRAYLRKAKTYYNAKQKDKAEVELQRVPDTSMFYDPAQELLFIIQLEKRKMPVRPAA